VLREQILSMLTTRAGRVGDEADCICRVLTYLAWCHTSLQLSTSLQACIGILPRQNLPTCTCNVDEFGATRLDATRALHQCQSRRNRRHHRMTA
jgi:hypothetical protein